MPCLQPTVCTGPEKDGPTYADLTNECRDIGSERMFIQWKGKP